MSIKISVPALWDNQGTFLNNELKQVDITSFVQDGVRKPTGIFVPPFSGEITYTNTIQVKDPVFGTLFLDLTYADWLALVETAQLSPQAERTNTYTVGSDVTAGTDVVDPTLYNVTPNAIWLNGVEQDIRTIGYTQQPAATPPTGTFTFPAPFVNGDVIAIIYYNN